MGENPTPPKLLLTRREAATEIGLSEYELGKLVESGQLRSLRVGKNIRVHRASLEAFQAGRFDEASA